LADEFWDAGTGVKVVDLVKSHGELAKIKTERDVKIGARPKAPTDYKLEVPKEVKLPDGVTFKFDEKSPLIEVARTFAYESGADQGTFNKLVGAYVQEALQRNAAAGAAIAAERTKLGEKAGERIAAVEAGLKNILTAEQYAGMRSVITNAHAVAAVEVLLAKLNASGISVGADGVDPVGPTPKQPTEDDILRAMYPKMFASRS
jgi:hypothetical protein